MLNKLVSFVRQYQMLQPGDHVVCAVSGGADSVALLFALYLLREKLQITVSAAHFNHHLRGAESQRDEQFVRQFCSCYDIELEVGFGQIVSGKKGLEAAARDARYAFLNTLPGKIATAHTANDNAETMLMHLIRGTGLKGLCAISPVNGRLIRPMLSVTRQEVISFLQEYHLSYVTDSSNEQDLFLRNRLRHHVMPLLEQENPRLSENLSALALRLRQDEAALTSLVQKEDLSDVPTLRALIPALRSRAIGAFLERCGISEPESAHIHAIEKIVFSDKPSAKANLPGGIVILRNYDKLECCTDTKQLGISELVCPGVLELPEIGLRIRCTPAEKPYNEKNCFTVVPCGKIVVRCRQPGDTMKLSGGTKELKKLFIDRKIPAMKRLTIPVLADDTGVLGVYGFGKNLARDAEDANAVEIRFETI